VPAPSGEVAVVTGASRGGDRAIALVLGEAGATVTDRDGRQPPPFTVED
jgi:NAD(P)-dependent dehydrogenase (short-subunit alcohol dehydrogenase family)